MTTSVADRFHITGSSHPRPSATRTIYADGAADADDAGAATRGPNDIELSHWVPNTTDERYKADTSTEICLHYAADPARAHADLVVNDHVDVDGILSLYSLLHPDIALANRDVLVAASSMGDFHAAADRAGFRLAQELSGLFVGQRQIDAVELCTRAFDTATAVLTGAPEPPAVSKAWATLEAQHERLERQVGVEEVSDRLVLFAYPDEAGNDLEAALAVPALNALVDDSVWLWPEVRNRDHAQRVQLVSVPWDGRWFHDLWVPSYCWAETPNRWALPGLVSTGSSNTWRVEHAPLRDAISRLDSAETAAGRWIAADRLTPFTSMQGRAFPVIASFVDDHGAPAPSGLPPDRVAACFAPVW